MEATDDDIFSPKGREWWEAQAKACGVDNERIIRFAALKAKGVSNTRAAKLAGTPKPYAQNGYRLSRTKQYELLTVQTSIETGGKVGNVTAAEAKAIVSALARGSDPSVRLRAVELLAKLETQERESAKAPEWDGLSPSRIARDLITELSDYGAASFLLMMRGPCPCAPALSRLPLFHDVMPRALKVIPEFIKRDLAKHCQNMQDDYREITSNPDWQRSDRETVWGEVHWGIADNNEARPLIEGTPNGKG